MLHRINGLRNRQFESHFLDQAQGTATGRNGYLRKYKVDGTADGSCLLGAVDDSIAVDDVAGFYLTDGNACSGSTQNGVPGEWITLLLPSSKAFLPVPLWPPRQNMTYPQRGVS